MKYISGLVVSIESIRNSINLSEKWLNIEHNNCYSYALGIDKNSFEVCNSYVGYSPGLFSQNDLIQHGDNHYINYNDFINNIYLDLEALGINYKEVEPDYIINDNEWLISIFTKRRRNKLYDFHFARKTNNNYWIHKKGYMGEITNRDYNGKIMTNIKKSKMYNTKYEKTLCLKIK